VSRQTQPWDTLAADACNRLLSAGSRSFTALEIETDQLLAAEWPDGSRDICSGIPGVPGVTELRALAGIGPGE